MGLGFWSVDSLFYVESISSTSCLCLFSRPFSCSHVFLVFLCLLRLLCFSISCFTCMLLVSSSYSGLLLPMFCLSVTPTPFALDYWIISWLRYSTFNHSNVEADKWLPGYNQNNSRWHGGSGKETTLWHFLFKSLVTVVKSPSIHAGMALIISNNIWSNERKQAFISLWKRLGCLEVSKLVFSR